MISAVTVLLFAHTPPAEVRVDGRLITERATFEGRHRISIENQEDRIVNGTLELRPVDGRMRVLLRMPVEDYVAATLAAESRSFPPGEALKTMAVAVRSYALKNVGRHRREGADVCDTEHCQRLHYGRVAQKLKDAAAATRSEIVWYGDEPASVYYHEHCGGVTASAAAVWGGPEIPYLISQPDPYCVRFQRRSWTARVSRTVLAGLGAPLEAPIQVVSRTASGRVDKVGVGADIWSASKFRDMLLGVLGPREAPSNRFDTHEHGGNLVVEGQGSGHGVGLCQVGALARAAEGQDYRAILAAYFPGTTVGINPQGFRWDVASFGRIDFETTQGPPALEVKALFQKVAVEAQRRLGRAATKLHVRMHPSIAGFRAATGEADRNYYAVKDGVLHLQPVGVLRTTGALEQTVLRGVIGLLADQGSKAKLPEWFRQGLSLYLSGGRISRADRDAYWIPVAALAARYGEPAMLGWVSAGVPRDALARAQSAAPLLAIK